MKKLLFILFITILSCQEKISCDFDLKTTSYYMVKSNGEDWYLKEDGYKVIDKGDNYVKGDTCYLKQRAYNFWKNDERGTLSIYELEKKKFTDSIKSEIEKLTKKIKTDSLYTIIKTETKDKHNGTYNLDLYLWIRSIDDAKSIEYYDYKFGISESRKNDVQKNMITKAEKIKIKIDSKLKSKNEIRLANIHSEIERLKKELSN